jgi:hypothetical protein
MTRADVIREIKQRIEDECEPGIENVKTWADALEAAMREKDAEIERLREALECISTAKGTAGQVARAALAAREPQE